MRCVSLLAGNGAAFYRAVVEYLAQATGLPAAFEPASPASLSELVSANAVEVAFTCGLPYVSVTTSQPGAIRLLAAPVLPGERYGGRPIYFSDFVVRADAPWQEFGNLRGLSFAYNQAESLSGCVLPRHYLRGIGEDDDYFSRWAHTGSHAASLDWVERGDADTAAIDSFVLAMEFRQRPERARQLRVVASAGPLAMPPVVASGTLPLDAIQRLRAALTDMHATSAGRALLAAHGVGRFAAVTDQDYDGIRAVLAALAAAPHAV